MKLGNGVKALSLGVVLSFLSPAISSAKSDIELKIQSIIENEIAGASTINLSDVIYLHGTIAKIKEGENVYVMYYRKGKNGENVGILLLGIPYNKKEMGGFQSAMIGGINGPFQVLIAPEGKEIPGTDNFSIVKVK